MRVVHVALSLHSQSFTDICNFRKKNMKKLALAPAVALAITGLAASPVIAATEASAPAASADTQPAAQQNAKSALAHTNGQSSGDTEHQEGAEAQNLEAEISVSPKEVSQSDFMDPETAVQVTVTGLEAGDTISDDVSFEDDETVTAEGDSYTYTIYSRTNDPEAVAPGTINFTVTVERGDEAQDLSGAFTVVEDEADDPETPAADPKISVSDKEVTAEDLQNDGITVEGEGFTPGGEVDLIGGTAQSPFGVATVTADDDGTVSGTIKSEAALEPGEYSVWGSDQESETTSEPVTVTVVEEETEEPSTPAAEAELTVSPETISPADFIDEDKGVTLAVENCEPGEDVKFVVNPEGDSNVTAYEDTVNADDEGKASVNVYGTSSDASA